MSILDKASLIQIPSGYKNGKLYSVKPNPTYGSEEVTNGDFATDSDWSKGTGWTISGGKANCDGSQTSTSSLYQNAGLTIGAAYKAIVTISNYSAGNIRILMGGSTFGEWVNSNGEKTFILVQSFDQRIYVQADANFVGSIDNVSVKEITNIGDFDFSRSSSATRVNSEGLIEVASVVSTTELVTNGDFATDSDWNKLNGSTISGGVGTVIAGGNVEAGTSNWSLNQDTVFSANKKYKVNFRARQTSGSGKFQASRDYYFFIDQVITSSFVDYSFIVDSGSLNFTGNLVFGGRTSGDEFEVDNVSVKEVIENDVPRLDYSGGASCASLLLEGQSTNLVTYSESLSNSPIKSGTFTDNFATSPDGTQNATKITATSTDPFFYQSISFNASDYTASIYIKGIGDSIGKDFQIRLGANIYENTIPSEWTRFVYTATMTSITTNAGIEIPNPAVVGDEVLAWGWQLEESSYATSYIPSNSGSSTTRTADVCNNAGTSATFNDSEGVLFFEAARLNEADNSSVIWSISDGSNSNAVSLYYYASGIGVDIFNTLGTKSLSYTMTLTKQATLNKVAIKYKSNDIALWVNGSEVAINTDAISLSGLNQLMASYGSGSFPFYGKTKQLMVFDEALSDEELSDLTGQVNLSFNNLATFYGYTIL